MPPRFPGGERTIMVARKAGVKPQNAGANRRFVWEQTGLCLAGFDPWLFIRSVTVTPVLL